jgi:hypothetical protein
MRPGQIPKLTRWFSTTTQEMSNSRNGLKKRMEKKFKGKKLKRGNQVRTSRALTVEHTWRYHSCRVCIVMSVSESLMARPSAGRRKSLTTLSKMYFASLSLFPPICQINSKLLFIYGVRLSDRPQHNLQYQTKGCFDPTNGSSRHIWNLTRFGPCSERRDLRLSDSMK